MMKQKVILGFALSLGLGSALATVSLEAYAKINTPTPHCKELVEELSLHYTAVNTTQARVKIHASARLSCEKDGKTELQRRKNHDYFEMFANMPY